MKIIASLTLFVLLSLLGACKLTAEIKPNLECTHSCEAEKEDCVTVCKQECVDAGGGDPDAACDQDCDTTCTEGYDSCTLTCTEA